MKCICNKIVMLFIQIIAVIISGLNLPSCLAVCVTSCQMFECELNELIKARWKLPVEARHAIV